MKRCPECNSVFPDAERFCEVDGTALVSAAPQPKSSLTLLPIGVVVGLLLGVVLSLMYFAMSRQTTPPENSDTTSSTSNVRQQAVAPLQPAPVATPSASVEPSVEPSPSPSVETPSPQVEVTNSNPISTATKGQPVVIKLNSGTTIEADEAWQTGEGIWYRKHGLVALLDPKNVKAIEKVAPQPAASTSPSP